MNKIFLCNEKKLVKTSFFHLNILLNSFLYISSNVRTANMLTSLRVRILTPNKNRNNSTIIATNNIQCLKYKIDMTSMAINNIVVISKIKLYFHTSFLWKAILNLFSFIYMITIDLKYYDKYTKIISIKKLVQKFIFYRISNF